MTSLFNKIPMDKIATLLFQYYNVTIVYSRNQDILMSLLYTAEIKIY